MTQPHEHVQNAILNKQAIGLTDAKRIRQIARLIQASNGYREGANIWLGPWIHELLDLTEGFPVSLDEQTGG